MVVYMVVYKVQDVWAADSIWSTKEDAEKAASRYPNFIVREYPLGKELPISGCYEFADPEIKTWEWEY